MSRIGAESLEIAAWRRMDAIAAAVSVQGQVARVDRGDVLVDWVGQDPIGFPIEASAAPAAPAAAKPLRRAADVVRLGRFAGGPRDGETTFRAWQVGSPDAIRLWNDRVFLGAYVLQTTSGDYRWLSPEEWQAFLTEQSMSAGHA